MRETNCLNIFLKMVDSVRRGVPMNTRSANDKDYFAQDWFADRLEDAGVEFQQQGRNGVDFSRFLCGHDECQWFVAAVPGSASSVREAKEALKPEVVRESQARHKVKTKRRNKRKNDGFIRQSEWFFVSCPDMVVDEMLVLKNEPLRRGRGKPHMAEFNWRAVSRDPEAFVKGKVRRRITRRWSCRSGTVWCRIGRQSGRKASHFWPESAGKGVASM